MYGELVPRVDSVSLVYTYVLSFVERPYILIYELADRLGTAAITDIALLKAIDIAENAAKNPFLFILFNFPIFNSFTNLLELLLAAALLRLVNDNSLEILTIARSFSNHVVKTEAPNLSPFLQAASRLQVFFDNNILLHCCSGL